MPAGSRRPKTKTVRLTWRHARLEIRHTPDYLEQVHDHIEVRVRAPKGAPIPITATGYRSEFTTREAVEDIGGPGEYVRTWLEREAKTKAWEAAEFKWRQLELELLPPKPIKPTRSAPAVPSRVRRAGQGSR